MPQTQFPCETGSPSWNGEVLSLGVTINTTDEFDIGNCDEVFNHRRVDVTLRITPQGSEDRAQKKLVKGSHAEIRGEIDLTGFRRTDTNICLKLKFSGEAINGADLRELGPRSGLLIVHSHKPIPEQKKVHSKPANGQMELEEATEEEQAAYKEGCEAALAGKKAADNPYDPRTPKRIAWAKGHEATEAE